MVSPPDQTERAAAAHAQRRHRVRDPGGRLLRPPLQPPVSLGLLPDPGVTSSDGQQRGLRLVKPPGRLTRVLGLPGPEDPGLAHVVIQVTGVHGHGGQACRGAGGQQTRVNSCRRGRS